MAKRAEIDSVPFIIQEQQADWVNMKRQILRPLSFRSSEAGDKCAETDFAPFVIQILRPSGGSNLPRPGELGGKLLPYFAINRGKSEEERGSAILALLSLEIAEENYFREENPRQGASVTFP